MKDFTTLISSLIFTVGCSQVSVIHFNSEWNNKNDFDISVLKDCEKSNVVICNNPDLQDKHEIFSVPTIIIFDDDVEQVRFQANIMLKMDATKEEIQDEIQKIHLAKFD
tara:strand:- start:906 stop:1232 length:327 start_codon:yes stop_codon:yes gene_type:complete